MFHHFEEGNPSQDIEPQIVSNTGAASQIAAKQAAKSQGLGWQVNKQGRCELKIWHLEDSDIEIGAERYSWFIHQDDGLSSASHTTQQSAEIAFTRGLSFLSALNSEFRRTTEATTRAQQIQLVLTVCTTQRCGLNKRSQELEEHKSGLLRRQLMNYATI